ncbi:MAG: hypothetical protein ABSE93_16800 [Terriglobia bacterium]
MPTGRRPSHRHSRELASATTNRARSPSYRRSRIPPTDSYYIPIQRAGVKRYAEDCGGIYGYYAKLEALRDPKHPEHNEVIDWMGEDFDPEAFDLQDINSRLKWLSERRLGAGNL